MTAPLDPARWAEVTDVFHQALDLPPADRHDFLASACGADDALRAEVASLLDAHDREHAGLDRPAVTARDLMTDAEVRALVGRTVGHYAIRDVLGIGGMGIVYLADDSRLGRAVALKALPAGMAGHDGRRERLRQEARTAARLHDPGIATIYALEEIDDRLYIASEFVPGRSLRDELAAGPLTPADAARTGLAIARALAVAHRHGVVHRDLKPENVMRTPDGAIKILDFGLARLHEPDGGEARLTGAGTLLGTPAYMAPEQIRGEAVDARADVFSFGALLHELLSGASPFAGADSGATIARVLEAEATPVPVAASATDAERALAGRLDAVIRRCLRKRAADRFASAAEIADALRLDGPVPADGPRIRHPIWWWQFHQAVATTGHLVLLLPLWFAGVLAGRPVGLAIFLAGLAGALSAGVLRMHQWFAVRSYPVEAARQRARIRSTLSLADLTLAAACAAAGLLVLDGDAPLGILLTASAVAVPLVSLVVEPATTRAAFEGHTPTPADHGRDDAP